MSIRPHLESGWRRRIGGGARPLPPPSALRCYRPPRPVPALRREGREGGWERAAWTRWAWGVLGLHPSVHGAPRSHLVWKGQSGGSGGSVGYGQLGTTARSVGGPGLHLGSTARFGGPVRLKGKGFKAN